MKKIILILLVTVISISSYSQSKSKALSYNGEGKYIENVSTIFVQVIADVEIDKEHNKIRVVLGDDNKFYIKNKNDFEIFEQIRGEVSALGTIPDVLNYLSDKGFVLESHSTVLYGSIVRHELLLSRTTFE